MTDRHQPEPSTGEEDRAPERPLDPEENPVAEAPGSEADAAAEDAAEDTSDGASDGPDAVVPGEGAPAAREKQRRKGVLLGVGGAVVGVLIVALAVAAFSWPGFLVGPGAPDDTATRAVAALASKDPAEVDKVSCRGPDGAPVSQLPPQALQVIQGVKQTGAPELVLDTQAQAPIDLTLSAQGQTQDLPADVVLGVTDGEWCMTGIAQRQPPMGG